MSFARRVSLIALLSFTVLPALALAETPPLALEGLPDGKAKDIRPQDVIIWDGFQAEEQDGDKIKTTLRMTAKGDWKVYASNLKFSGPPGFTVEAIQPPPARRFMDPISNQEVDIYEGGEFTLTFSGAPRWTQGTFPVAATYVGCTNVICLFPYTQNLDLAFVKDALLASAPEATTATAAAEDDDLESRLAKQLSGGTSFGMLLFLVFVGGLLSNLTPCVYPMIPITLRLLSRQGRSPYAAATAYAFGIVVTYSALGLVAALSGGLFGSLLASKAFNVGFAVVMMLLGVTMLGFGNFSKLQMLGNRLGTGAPSLKNTFLMGAGAGLVAAPCTGPILAALLAYTAKNNAGVVASTVLLFTYSLGFGLPYIALGGAAAKVSAVKVPPHVQIGVKLFFASVMFGLGLYYLRIPFYQTFETMNGSWKTVATYGLTLGGVLAAIWVVVPKLQNAKFSMILPTAVLGIGIFAASQWLTHRGSGTGTAHDSVTWHHTEADGIAAASAAHKPILIDMWAEWCEACKKMDATTFSDPKVLAALAQDWTLVKLDLTELNEANDQIQQKYGIQSLPTLVLLPPSGDAKAKLAINGYVTPAVLQKSLAEFNGRAE